MDSIDFRTPLRPRKYPQSISDQDRVMTIGSCFSDVIGNYLSKYKFDVLSNPFGTVYNPISIFNYLNNFEFDQKHFTQSSDLFFHFDAHSKFNAKEQSTLDALLRIRLSEFNEYLKSCDWLIITLGTAFTYILKSSGNVVANCQKVPQSQFLKQLPSKDAINDSFDNAVRRLSHENPKLRVLLTVSPVRHIKDGLEENSLSKALLRTFCHDVSSRYENVFYFPSYEIMIDDLRDYRFYKEDMIHPNRTAEDYIWNFFQESFFVEKTKLMLNDWSKILSAMNHKPFNPSSNNHQKFIKNTLKNLESFSEKFDISNERKLLESQLL